jgi:hypothetical protein
VKRVGYQSIFEKKTKTHTSVLIRERMRAYKAAQIPRSETQDIQILKIQTKLFYCKK